MAISGINALIATQTPFNIGNAFKEGMDEGRIRNALVYASQNYGNNPQAAANALLEVGDVQGANRIIEGVRRQEEAVADRAFREREFASNQDFRRQSLALQRAQEARLSRPERDLYAERAAAAQKFGIKEGTPEYQSFVLYGKAPEGPDPLFGNSAESIAISQLVREGKMTLDAAARWIASKTAARPDGGLDLVSPPMMDAGAQPAPGPAQPGVQTIREPQPKPTESNLSAAGFYERANQADVVLSDPKYLASQQSNVQRGMSNIPLVGGYMTSPEFQQADQAKRNFITAVLRRESGATIAPSEFETAEKQYFPQPGDDDATIKQKAATRRTVIEGLRRSAGPAAPGGGSANYKFNIDTGDIE